VQYEVFYLRRATVRRRRYGQNVAATTADRDGQSATTWPTTGHRHRCRCKTRRRIPDIRRSRVQFGPPR